VQGIDPLAPCMHEASKPVDAFVVFGVPDIVG
jgi:hypothetical protein